MDEIARLRLPARSPFQLAATAFAAAAAGAAGLPPGRLPRVHEAVTEAFANVVRHAFDPGSPGTVEVVLERRDGFLVVAVEDRGLPVDVRRLEQGLDWGGGLRRMQAASDGLAFRNLGPGGKRVEARWRLQPHPDEPTRPPEAAPTGPLEIRLMGPEDAEGLARCMFRSYGYTYTGQQVYYPERVEALLRGGLQVSAVAVAPDGEIVGHLALVRESPDQRVADSCEAAVDPRYRGHGLFEKLKALLVEEGRRLGLYGLYSEAVTVHPYSQKGNLALGAREVGLELAAVPPSQQFHGLEDHPAGRSACMLMYLRLDREPERIVYPPPRHEAMVRDLYEGLDLRRAVARDAPPESREAALVATLDEPDNEAFLNATPGPGLRDLLAAKLRELCLKRVDAIYLDLPLGSPACPRACQEAEELGFSFAGVIPELRGGDALRLQYLNEVEIDPGAVRTASSFGERLARYVFACASGGDAGPSR